MGLSQLDILYDFEPKKIGYINRKTQITSKKVIIHYSPKSGVTYLLYSHMQNYKSSDYLYIDFRDIRLEKDIIKQNLKDYIYRKNIKLLILENFDFSFDLPKCDEIIITTNYKYHYKGFECINFFPLDFEEFIAFERSNSKIENIFNSYANNGTFPSISHINEVDRIRYLQDITMLISQNKKQLYILKHLSKLQSMPVSLYGVFGKIKKEIKISKDMFYELVEDLKQRRIILFLDKYNYPKAAKKIFLIDFTIKNAISFEKDFIKRFENIVFLEIYKRDKIVYYTDDMDFYLPKENMAILCIAFMPPALLRNKIVKRKKAFKKLNIKKVFIISLGNEDQFCENEIEYEIIPFWNWAASI